MVRASPGQRLHAPGRALGALLQLGLGDGAAQLLADEADQGGLFGRMRVLGLVMHVDDPDQLSVADQRHR